MIELKENDNIVHAAHGVGTVKGLTIKILNGEKQLFYIVKTDKLTYWLPVVNSHSDRVRPVRAPSTFSNALSVIRKKPKKMSDNFRSRLKHIKEELAKCSLSANLKLIRDMHARNFEKPLHVNESRTYEKIKEQYIKEWSISADISKAEAEKKLDDALVQSVKKVQSN